MVRKVLPRRWKRSARLARQACRFTAAGAAFFALLLASVIARSEEEDVSPADPVSQELGLQTALFEKIAGDDESSLAAIENVDEESPGAYLRGLLLLERGELEQAIELLEPIARDAEADDPVQMYLAAALLHSGEVDRAQALIAPYLTARPDDPQALYLDGVALAMRGEHGTAESRFRRVGMRITAADQVVAASYQESTVDAPLRFGTADEIAGRPVSGRSQRFNPPRATTPRRFHFTLLTGIEYDTNVSLAPEFIGLGAVSERDDARAIVATFADLQILAGQQVNAGLIASTFNSFHFDQDAFDLQDYMGGAYSNAVLADDLIGGIRYEYHSTLLNHDHLASEHRLTPNLTWLGSRGHTTVYYEYNPISSSAPALIPAQRQSADIQGTGLTQAIYTFGGQGRIYLGYRFETADAEGDDFDRDTHMATARLERPLPRGWIGDAEVRHFWNDYDQPNSLDFFGRPREDDRWEVRFGLQRNFLNTPWSLRFDYTYFDNTSNVENLFGVRFYEYDRHIVSTQLIYSF